MHKVIVKKFQAVDSQYMMASMFRLLLHTLEQSMPESVTLELRGKLPSVRISNKKLKRDGETRTRTGKKQGKQKLKKFQTISSYFFLDYCQIHIFYLDSH